MGKDVLGCQLSIGDIILFYSRRKGQICPARVLEFIKGDCIGIERGYFLKSGEITFFNKPERDIIFSTQAIRPEPFKVAVSV